MQDLSNLTDCLVQAVSTDAPNPRPIKLILWWRVEGAV